MTDEANTGKNTRKKKPWAPEMIMAYSTLFSPIIGAIYAAINWKKLGNSQHIWWTILTGIVVSVLGVILDFLFGTYLIGIVINYIWGLIIALLQRRVTPKEIESLPSWIIAIAGLFLVIYVYQNFIHAHHLKPPVLQGSSVSIGTTLSRNVQSLPVSGTNYLVDTILYARVLDSPSFNSTNITFMIQKKEGSGWIMVIDKNYPVNPQDGIEVIPFYVSIPGTYEASFLNGNNVIAQTTFITR